jgi:hypothetical protein
VRRNARRRARLQLNPCPSFINTTRKPVALQKAQILGSATALSLQPPSPCCHPERRERTCGAPFVCPAPIRLQPPPTSPNPHGNTNLPLSFRVSRIGPRNRRSLRSPGSPVEIGGVGELHAPLLTSKAHTQPRPAQRGRKSVSDDKKERVVARQEWLLNRGIFQSNLDRSGFSRSKS